MAASRNIILCMPERVAVNHSKSELRLETLDERILSPDLHILEIILRCLAVCFDAFCTFLFSTTILNVITRKLISN